jgi:hypothetical protein
MAEQANDFVTGPVHIDHLLTRPGSRLLYQEHRYASVNQPATPMLPGDHRTAGPSTPAFRIILGYGAVGLAICAVTLDL